jgi:hypothetical protein
MCGCTGNPIPEASEVLASIFRNPASLIGPPRSVTNTCGESGASRFRRLSARIWGLCGIHVNDFTGVIILKNRTFSDYVSATIELLKSMGRGSYPTELGLDA